MLSDSAVLQRVPTVVATDLGETIVLLDPKDGYLELNPVGSGIWDALVEPITFGALVILLAADFGVDAATVRRDIIPFVGTLADRGFVRVT